MKIWRHVFMSLLVFCAIGLATGSFASSQVTIKEPTTLMMKGADGKLAPKFKLKEGMKGTLLKKKGKWVGVNIRGKKGWVKASAVEIEGSGDLDAEEGDNSESEKSDAPQAHSALDLGAGFSPYLGAGAGLTLFFPISKNPSGSSWDLGVEGNYYFANSAQPITASLLIGFTGRGQSVQYFVGGQFLYLMLLKGAGSAIAGGLDSRLIFNTGKINPYLNLKAGFGGGAMILQFLGGVRFNL